jgi:hypothetical protein
VKYEVRVETDLTWGVYQAQSPTPVRLMGVPQIRMALDDARDLATVLNDFAAGHERAARRSMARQRTSDSISAHD